MSRNTLAIRVAQQGLTYSLRQIERNKSNENGHLWHILVAVREFERIHLEYRAQRNCFQDLSSHWAVSLVYSSMMSNDRVIDDNMRRIRRELHLQLCGNTQSIESQALLMTQISELSQLATKSLVVEIELLAQILDTVLGPEAQTSGLYH